MPIRAGSNVLSHASKVHPQLRAEFECVSVFWEGSRKRRCVRHGRRGARLAQLSRPTDGSISVRGRKADASWMEGAVSAAGRLWRTARAGHANLTGPAHAFHRYNLCVTARRLSSRQDTKAYRINQLGRPGGGELNGAGMAGARLACPSTARSSACTATKHCLRVVSLARAGARKKFFAIRRKKIFVIPLVQ
jgi:hypothetical protein